MDSEETENIKTEDKVGLEVVKVKEDLEVLEVDKEMVVDVLEQAVVAVRV